LQLSARDKAFSYQLHLTSSRPLVLQGDNGFSRKSDRARPRTTTVSRSFRPAAPAIDGQTYTVSGPAWLDREWSSQPLAANQTGWDWFSLHLDSGESLMLFAPGKPTALLSDRHLDQRRRPD
jgi:predicted secreted hydrolase